MLYLPTRIFFGSDALQMSAAKLCGLGSKALVITGKNSARLSGALDEVFRVLKQGGLDWQVFDKVEENPSLETVMEAAQVLSESGCDFLIGIGGGSPIDAAKAAALVQANKLSQEEIYRTDMFRKSLPLAAIPTTSGTGTEVTQYSVLTDTANNKKAGFGSDLAFPALAICDPRYTLTLGANSTLYTAIDALSHLLEGIYSNKRNTLLYPLIHNGVQAILSNLKPVLKNPGDLKGREALMRASLYGGMTIAQASTTLQHSIGYPLTSNFGVPHGLSNGIVMRQMMELYYPALEMELNALFDAVGISRGGFYEWLESLELQAELDLSEEFIEKHVPEVLGSRNMANNPFPIGAEEIAAIYRNLS